MKLVKKMGKILLLVLGLLIAAAVLFVLYLTVTEYRPDGVEDAAAGNLGSEEMLNRREISVLSFNTGYAGLGQDADFFMDGGSSVRPGSRETVQENMQGILETALSTEADFYLLQEVDTDSKRSYHINQWSFYEQMTGFGSFFAPNYSCPYVPYPLPTIGKVNSGLLTMSALRMEEARRYALPCPFSWPVSTANLKRCLLVSYVPIRGTEQYLVLVNLHLEAYDDGEGKAAQTRVLMEFLESEYEKGNYVIAGGDFNQTFPGTLEEYPVRDGDIWTPGVLEESALPEGWTMAYDTSVPTCRLLNQPYDAGSEGTQYYVIDGFILSPNVKLEQVTTIDQGFTWSDHNPVLAEVTLCG